MKEHVLTICEPAKATPSNGLPDGAITGNGDITAVLAGSADRVRIYISKADFWKADGRVYTKSEGYTEAVGFGGLAPLGLVEILLPHLAYADYRVEQNLDEAAIKLDLTEKGFDASLTITACAEENTFIFELDRSHPMVSASIALLPIEGNEAITESGSEQDVTYSIRGFDTPACRFPSYGICALRQISRSVANGRERIVWALSVCTNHDTAAYRRQAIERAKALSACDCERLLEKHAAWWQRFWAKSGVELADKKLELYWYASLYAIACCARNKKFPPGLWGNYSTADGMRWFGDYHLNYNFEAPFYALTSSNHTELMECYCAPINDFLPVAKRYAKDFLGVDGVLYPVGIGPLGLETDERPKSKEHGHLFLGQKSNAAYAAVIPMMHWYGTRDTAFARREYYDFLLSVTEFWENYLVFEDGKYQIYNDCLNEVEWWAGPDHMPHGHDEKNPIVSRNLVRMLMKLMIDLSTTLGENTEKIEKWQHILDHIPIADTFEHEGEAVLRGVDGCEVIREVSLEAMYPIGAIGKYATPELFKVAKNTHKHHPIWKTHNRFCSYYPMAARLEYPSEEIIAHIHEMIEKSGLPNGMFRCHGGGLENSTGIPATVNEMLLQSYEDIIRLFPVWDRNSDASFHGLRANGAFVVDAALKGGKIRAELLSEQGRPLTIEAPGDGYVLLTGDGKELPLTEKFTTVDTKKGERIKIFAK